MNAILKAEPAEIDTAHMKVSPGLERIVRHSWRRSRQTVFSRRATWRLP